MVRRRMAYIGQEPQRQTIKYRWGHTATGSIKYRRGHIATGSINPPPHCSPECERLQVHLFCHQEASFPAAQSITSGTKKGTHQVTDLRFTGHH